MPLAFRTRQWCLSRIYRDCSSTNSTIKKPFNQNPDKLGWYPPTEQTVRWKLQLHCHKSWENRPSLQTLGPSHPERIQAPGCCFPTLIGHSSTSTTLGCKIAWSLVSKIERPETSFKEPQEFVEIQVFYHIFGVPSHQYIFAAVPGLRLGSCFGRSSTWSTSWWKSHRESLQVWKLRAKDATAHGISHLLRNCTGSLFGDFWWHEFCWGTMASLEQKHHVLQVWCQSGPCRFCQVVGYHKISGVESRASGLFPQNLGSVSQKYLSSNTPLCWFLGFYTSIRNEQCLTGPLLFPDVQSKQPWCGDGQGLQLHQYLSHLQRKDTPHKFRDRFVLVPLQVEQIREHPIPKQQELLHWVWQHCPVEASVNSATALVSQKYHKFVKQNLHFSAFCMISWGSVFLLEFLESELSCSAASTPHWRRPVCPLNGIRSFSCFTTVVYFLFSIHNNRWIFSDYFDMIGSWYDNTTAAVLHEFRQFASILCHHCLLHGLTGTKEALHEKEAVTQIHSVRI